MPPKTGFKRKRLDDNARTSKVRRKFKKQESYHSSSEDEAAPVRSEGVGAKIEAEINGDLDLLEDDEDADVELPDMKLNAQATPKPSRIVDEPLEKDADDASVDDESDGGAPIHDQDPSVDNTENEDEDEDEDEDEADVDPDRDDADSDSDIESTSTATRALKKRNDPSVLATSISKILSSKLTTKQRSDPVLARSKLASEMSKQIAEDKLEARTRSKLREDKRVLKEKGREKDLLGLDREDVDTGGVLEKEKALRRTAQKGVVKLFNAVRAAQVKSEEEERRVRGEGVVGMEKRKERVEDMGKKAFLDLLVEGGGG